MFCSSLARPTSVSRYGYCEIENALTITAFCKLSSSTSQIKTMSQDSQYTFSRPELVDLMDEFLINTTLPDDDIMIPPEHQPVNPESENEVPNQEAVNGIARANRPREPAWRYLGLTEMATRAPDAPHTTGVMEAGDRLRALNIHQRQERPTASRNLGLIR